MKWTACLMLVVLVQWGCSENERVRDSSPQTCPGGELMQSSAGEVCVYRGAIVIETGFSCPSAFPHMQAGPEFVLCTSEPGITQALVDELAASLGVQPWSITDPDIDPHLVGLADQ
ncbi:MAG: hypothetical protein H0U74_01960 [Bradymonadaceae bacterium]|nr:hypothetical protein [Lujinxingiaceae bacterium]